MPNCTFCDKNAAFKLGTGALTCPDCYLKMQQAVDMQTRRTVDMLNYEISEMEAVFGLSGVLPKYNMPQPTIHNNPLNIQNLHNIKVDRSIVGNINTGSIQSLNISMNDVRLNFPELGKELEIFVENLVYSEEIDNNLKNEIIEQISFIAEQVALEKEQRKTTILSSIVNSLPAKVLGLSASLLAHFDKLYPLIKSALGF